MPVSTNKVFDPKFEASNTILLPNSEIKTLCIAPGHDALAFRVESTVTHRTCFCSVDFHGGHGGHGDIAVAPRWMLSEREGLMCGAGTEIKIRQVTLPKATYIKLKLDKRNEELIFRENKNIKSLLEKALEHVIVVFVGLRIRTTNPSNSAQTLELEVVELKPTQAVLLTNASPEVEFQFPEHADSSQSSNSSSSGSAKENVVGKSSGVSGAVSGFGFSDDEATPPESPIQQQKACQQQQQQQQHFMPSLPMSSSLGHTLGSSNLCAGKGKVCANCGKRIPDAQYRIHSLRCRSANVKCDECGEVLDKASAEAHKKTYHTQVECPKCGESCKGTVMLAAHECPLGLVPCKYCELDVVRRDLPEHVRICGSKTTKCEKCGKNVKNFDLDEHRSNNCKMMCPLCAKLFDDAEKLQRHAASCEGVYISSDDDVVIVHDVPEMFRTKK